MNKRGIACLVIAGGAAVRVGVSAKRPVEAAMLPKFSHSTAIDNPYLPLASLKQDVLEGAEKGKTLRVERTRMPGTKTFTIGARKVEAVIVEDREWSAGKLNEVTLDYFAQDDDGNVYYLGEDVNNYLAGKITGHEGAWMYGVKGAGLGLVMPAHPSVGQKFKSEQIGKGNFEADEIVSVTESVDVKAGKFERCVKVQEKTSDGEREVKFYAPGVGAVREADAQLISHR